MLVTFELGRCTLRERQLSSVILVSNPPTESSDAAAGGGAGLPRDLEQSAYEALLGLGLSGDARDAAVAKLLASHPDHADALRRLADSLVNADQLLPPADAGPPKRIGPYRILQRLGEGSMGVVYLAEQREPVHRRVALKVIKLGMDTPRLLARFEAERQALSMMSHSGIARVLDGGMDERGRPYFAMEYVKGDSVTKYCERRRLDLEARLRLFARICHAVQHAHQKGIIHRDIKPSNILVVEEDGAPLPKVIDFGLARAMDIRLTERTLFTEHGMLVGTPEYMSPEQAEGSAVEIDTRTDIYSLGAILYELLAGVPPFDHDELRRAGFLELQRHIRDVEPTKPSSRVRAQATATDTRVQQNLARELHGDLDWIVMKSLEKDPSRRYRTADAFADDIGRYLELQPVSARPPSLSYRVGKFARRHRAPVLSVAVAVTALVIGILIRPLLPAESSAKPELDYVDLRGSQTAAKTQGQRRLGHAFAVVAALEAAYARANHPGLDLSEEFANWMANTTWLADEWETVAAGGVTFAENRLGPDEQGHGIDLLVMLASGLRLPVEDRMPYHPKPYELPDKLDRQDQASVNSVNLDPKFLPRSALVAPTYYAAKGYRRIKGPSDPAQIESALRDGHEVVLDFLVGGDRSGPIWRAGTTQSSDRRHSVLIVGYDRSCLDPNDHCFLAKNSDPTLGTTAAHGIVRLAYDYLRFGQAAGYFTAVRKPGPWPEVAFIGRWNICFDGHCNWLDIYHLPGAMTEVRKHHDEPITDRRLGMLIRAPESASRINGSIEGRHIELGMADFGSVGARGLNLDWATKLRHRDGRVFDYRLIDAVGGQMAGWHRDRTDRKVTGPYAGYARLAFEQLHSQGPKLEQPVPPDYTQLRAWPGLRAPVLVADDLYDGAPELCHFRCLTGRWRLETEGSHGELQFGSEHPGAPSRDMPLTLDATWTPSGGSGQRIVVSCSNHPYVAMGFNLPWADGGALAVEVRFLGWMPGVFAGHGETGSRKLGVYGWRIGN